MNGLIMYGSFSPPAHSLLEKQQELPCISLELNVDAKFQIQLTCQNWLAETQEKHHSGTAELGLTVGKIHLEACIEIK